MNYVRRTEKEPRPGTFLVRETRAGKWRVLLIGANGEPMSVAQTYTRRYDAHRSIGTHRRVAATARVRFVDRFGRPLQAARSSAH